jgi:Transglycosylase SLT domain
MNIAQLSEQLKDVPQNRLIDYARNPNSVVPQFLALAEIQRRQHLQAQVQPPAATVAEDVLAQATPPMAPRMVPRMAAEQMAQQLPENQPGVARLPTGMPQGMASGGIVAFAGGDLVDDDEDDEYYDPEEERIRKDEKLMMSLIAGLRSKAGQAMASVPRAVAAIPKAVEEIRTMLPESYEAAKAKTESGITTLQRKGAHPYESIALDEAKKFGLDPNLVRHVLNKETGGLKDPATAVSKAGARGPMQLMPGTAKDLGIDINDPEQNTRGGVRYLAQMMERFKDPTLALAGYNAGPARVQQMLNRGLGIESLKPETQQYVKYSQGGIASFAGDEGSKVEEDEDYSTPYLERSRGLYSGVRNLYDVFTTPKNYDLYDMYQNYIGKPFASGVSRFVNEPQEEQAAKFRSYSMTPKTEPVVDYSSPITKNVSAVPITYDALQMTPAERNRYATIAANNALLQNNPPTVAAAPAPYVPLDTYDIGFGANKSAPDREIEQAGPQEVDPYKAGMLRAAQEREDIKAQAEQDKYLALLQAGLGMMAGTSPYAMANIGQGGMQGVAAYAAAKKQRAAELSDINKYEARLMSAKELSEIKREQLKSLDEERQQRAMLNRERLDLKASDSADIAARKRLELINRAQQDAASDPEYKSIVKIRDQLPEDDPKRKQYDDYLEAIKKSYIATAQTGKYVPPVRPVFPTVVKEPSFFERIMGKGSSAPSLNLTPEQQVLLDKYPTK